MVLIGCARADPPGVYRESQGKVTKFTVELTDQALTIAAPFIRLQDGSVINPTLYFYQYHRVFFGGRQVEKIGRTFRGIGRDLKTSHRAFHLPTSEEIDTYLLLVRTSVLKEGRKPKAKPDKADYEMGDWQLLEIPAKDLSPEKPLVIPAYEELRKRELTKEQKELLKDLVQMYDKSAAAARKKATTPVGFAPMDCEAPRNPGTYLQGCDEVIPVSVRLSDPLVRVARFVRLQDGSILRPTFKYFIPRKNPEENGNAFCDLCPGGPTKKWTLDLPQSKEIAEHLLLVRRSFHKDAVPKYVDEIEQNPISKKRQNKADYVWANWQLLEIPPEDISRYKSLVFPSYEELAKRELSKEKKELLADLVARHDKIAAAAKKKEFRVRP